MASLDYNHIADLYDSYVTTNLDVPFYVNQARGCGQVLELMSGTGRVSLPLLEAGIHLTCVDSSSAMLERLCTKVKTGCLSADIREMDVCTLNLDRQFDLIILPFNSFAEITDLASQHKALSAIRKHLQPGGRFICPLHNAPTRLKLIDGVKKARGQFPFGNKGQTLVLSSVETHDDIPGLVRGTQFYDIVDPGDHLLQHREVDICFYLHTEESFGKLVREAGYRVEEMYGDYDCGVYERDKSPFMIWVLELQEGARAGAEE